MAVARRSRRCRRLAVPRRARPAVLRTRAAASRMLSAASRMLLFVALAALLVAALAAGCGGGGAGGTPASPASGPPIAPAPSRSAGASPSSTAASAPSTAASAGASTPTVYLLGGSGARESIVSNADWSAELSRRAGFAVRAVDLGATNQSFVADRRYVCNMDDGPKVVVIGVGFGRFTSPPPTSIRCDKKLSPSLQEALDGELEIEHRYSEDRIKSVAKKEQLLQIWLAERYPLFRANYAANRDELEKLLQECRRRGFAAALLELPLDLEVIGDRFDTPREQYQKDCRKLAARYQIPWITFVDELALPDTSFYDLMHLVEPGRVRWQTRLTEEVVPLLKSLAGAARE